MTFVLVGAAAFLASGLTLYSGFGLGTVLLPVFALLFPVPTAVATTAIVHLLNNIFKVALVLRLADWSIVARFGLPAAPAAMAGAWLLTHLPYTSQVFTWDIAGRTFGPSAAGLIVGLLLVTFATLELQPWFQRLAAPRGLLPVGGLLTGFIGGLTGHQGALRSMFLLKSGLAPAQFVGTGVLIALLVDLSRIPVYAASFANGALRGEDWRLVLVATICAFAGAFLGVRLLGRATIEIVRMAVASLMIAVGAALVTGVIH